MKSKIPLIAAFVILFANVLVWSLFLFKSAPSLPEDTAIPLSEDKTTDDCRIIALGDSITAGYNLDPKDAYPAKLETLLGENGYPCAVVNAGVSGDTSKGLLERLDFTLGDESYDLAILTIGGNDGLRQLPIEDLRVNITDILKKLQEKKIPILLAGMQIPDNAGNYSKEFREMYSDIARELSIPIYPFFLEGVAMDRKYNLSDNIHPNAQGYTIIARNLFDFLKNGGYLKNIPKK